MTEEKNSQRKFLHFVIGDKDYLLLLDVVNEVLRYRPVTQVPTVPDIIHGVFNLRGTYVPVADLAKRLDLSEQTGITKKTCILLTECESDNEHILVGLLVDEVNEVLAIDETTLSEPPKFGHSIAVDLIQGMFRKDDKDYIVLEVNKLLNLDELLAILEQASSTDELVS